LHFSFRRRIGSAFVELCQLDQLHKVYTPITGFALRQERMRHAQVFGDFPLAEANFFSRVYQTLKHVVVYTLVRSGPRLARLSGLGVGSLLHISSAWKP
jgi:hypothetical protein